MEAKWLGSVHDSRIYCESNLNNRLQRGKQPKDLHNIIHLSPSFNTLVYPLYITGKFDGFLLGDMLT